MSASSDLSDSVPDSEHFTTAQVLYSLIRAGELMPELRSPIEAQNKGSVSFLREGQNADGTWSFWTRRTFRPVDPDVDVTACVGAALRAAGEAVRVPPGLLDARAPDGRFSTWIRARAENDFDAVANANVAWWLSPMRCAGALRWAMSVASRADARGGEGSYYETPHVLYYALGRALWGRSIPAAVRELKEACGQFPEPRDSLEWAYSACLRHSLGLTCRGVTNRLQEAQRPDGSWPQRAVWNGPELPAPRSMFWGSEAWTTALAIEALAGCRCYDAGRAGR